MGAGVEEHIIMWSVGAHTVCLGDPFEIFLGVIEVFSEPLKSGRFVYVVVLMLWENGACRRCGNLD